MGRPDLPIAAKAWTRQRYAKSTGRKAQDSRHPGIATPPIEATDQTGRCLPRLTSTRRRTRSRTARSPLADLIGEPLVNGKICCPFHDDTTPSLHIYPDHYHCFVCGAHGERSIG